MWTDILSSLPMLKAVLMYHNNQGQLHMFATHIPAYFITLSEPHWYHTSFDEGWCTNISDTERYGAYDMLAAFVDMWPSFGVLEGW